MKILVTGSTGQLGAAICSRLAVRHEIVALTAERLDVRDARAVESAVRSAAPDAIVNCAAFTNVDAAEDQPVEALDVNAFAVCWLARAAVSTGSTLVHFSTDFVFDGSANRPYSEDDDPSPRSTYACSKLIGEWFARDAARHYVLRVESLFGAPPLPGAVRRTSVDRVVDAIAEGREARVFVDRVVTPSYTVDVAAAVEALLVTRPACGLYHCVNSGSCTWVELAEEVGRQLAVVPRLQPVRMSDAGLRARRPLYCALDNRKLAAAGIPMPSWQDAIGRYLRDRTTVAPS